MSQFTSVLVRTIINGGGFCAMLAIGDYGAPTSVYVIGVIWVAFASFFSYEDGARS